MFVRWTFGRLLFALLDYYTRDTTEDTLGEGIIHNFNYHEDLSALQRYAGTLFERYPRYVAYLAAPDGVLYHKLKEGNAPLDMLIAEYVLYNNPHRQTGEDFYRVQFLENFHED